MIRVCAFCIAKKWIYETFVFYCDECKVVLHQFEDSPDLIKSLIVDTHPKFNVTEVKNNSEFKKWPI